eukprot:TRINITY_DN66629_c1_g15_i1.p1 TRINITY_DN66629_c1_g15~~TRINITY_DN66629_c1_g15_i1.p1  ORF type:complete len:707 (+),score=157.80 TRINITY_DN66629_c1_g15_i1:43-2163(+)
MLQFLFVVALCITSVSGWKADDEAVQLLLQKLVNREQRGFREAWRPDRNGPSFDADRPDRGPGNAVGADPVALAKRIEQFRAVLAERRTAERDELVNYVKQSLQEAIGTEIADAVTQVQTQLDTLSQQVAADSDKERMEVESEFANEVESAKGASTTAVTAALSLLEGAMDQGTDQAFTDFIGQLDRKKESDQEAFAEFIDTVAESMPEYKATWFKGVISTFMAKQNDESEIWLNSLVDSFHDQRDAFREDHFADTTQALNMQIADNFEELKQEALQTFGNGMESAKQGVQLRLESELSPALADILRQTKEDITNLSMNTIDDLVAQLESVMAPNKFTRLATLIGTLDLEKMQPDRRYNLAKLLCNLIDDIKDSQDTPPRDDDDTPPRPDDDDTPPPRDDDDTPPPRDDDDTPPRPDDDDAQPPPPPRDDDDAQPPPPRPDDDDTPPPPRPKPDDDDMPSRPTETGRRCNDLADLREEIGFCNEYLGVGVINGQCNYIYGCELPRPRVGGRRPVFDSLDECREYCGEVSEEPTPTEVDPEKACCTGCVKCTKHYCEACRRPYINKEGGCYLREKEDPPMKMNPLTREEQHQANHAEHIANRLRGIYNNEKEAFGRAQERMQEEMEQFEKRMANRVDGKKAGIRRRKQRLESQIDRIERADAAKWQRIDEKREEDKHRQFGRYDQFEERQHFRRTYEHKKPTTPEDW